MRILPIAQSILGLLGSLCAWLLTGVKAHVPEVQTPTIGFLIDSRPPDATLEFVLLFLGLAIVSCALVQLRSHIRFSVPQLILGLLIVVISAPLAIRAATLGHGEISVLYYIVYLIIPLGLAVFGLGVAQTIKTFRRN